MNYVKKCSLLLQIWTSTFYHHQQKVYMYNGHVHLLPPTTKGLYIHVQRARPPSTTSNKRLIYTCTTGMSTYHHQQKVYIYMYNGHVHLLPPSTKGSYIHVQRACPPTTINKRFIYTCTTGTSNFYHHHKRFNIHVQRTRPPSTTINKRFIYTCTTGMSTYHHQQKVYIYMYNRHVHLLSPSTKGLYIHVQQVPPPSPSTKGLYIHVQQVPPPSPSMKGLYKHVQRARPPSTTNNKRFIYTCTTGTSTFYHHQQKVYIYMYNGHVHLPPSTKGLYIHVQRARPPSITINKRYIYTCTTGTSAFTINERII